MLVIGDEPSQPYDNSVQPRDIATISLPQQQQQLRRPRLDWMIPHLPNASAPAEDDDQLINDSMCTCKPLSDRAQKDIASVVVMIFLYLPCIIWKYYLFFH